MKLGTVVANAEMSTRAGEFITAAKLLAATGAWGWAAQEARSRNATPRVINICEKAAVDAGTFGSGNWAENLGEMRVAVAAFLDSLRTVGAFDRMLPAMRRVPLRTKVGIVATGASGHLVPAGHVTPVSSLSITGDLAVEERKALAIVAASEELVRLSGASDLFGRELRGAVALKTDESFLDLITESVSPITSAGGTSVAALADLAAAFTAVPTSMASSLFILTSPTIAKRWAFMTTKDGAMAFPNMTPQGGTIAGTPVVATDALTGEIVVADANQIAADAGTLEIDSTRQADVEMQTTPMSPPDGTTALENLWQKNWVALKAMRFFGAKRLTSNGVAVVTGVSYSGSPE